MPEQQMRKMIDLLGDILHTLKETQKDLREELYEIRMHLANIDDKTKSS